MKKLALTLTTLAALGATAVFAAAPAKPCTAANEGETVVTYSGRRGSVEEHYTCSGGSWELTLRCANGECVGF
jgi:hypothetical protein